MKYEYQWDDRELFDEGELYIDEESPGGSEGSDSGLDSIDKHRFRKSVHGPKDPGQCLDTASEQAQDEPLDLSVGARSPVKGLIKVRSDLVEPGLEEALDLSVSSKQHRSSVQCTPHWSSVNAAWTQHLNRPRFDYNLAGASNQCDFTISNESKFGTVDSSFQRLASSSAGHTSPARRWTSAAPPPPRPTYFANHAKFRVRPKHTVASPPEPTAADAAAGRRTAGSEDRDPKPVKSTSSSAAAGQWNLTVKDMQGMISPYVAWEDKKVVCKVCNIKFNYLERAYSHIENKHIDCFQYKCPLCRTTKTSRLAFDCHVRSRHNIKAKLTVLPLLRLKRPFDVRDERNNPKNVQQTPNAKERKSGHYDLMFLTFLRDELNSSPPLSRAERVSLMDIIQKSVRSSASPPSSPNNKLLKSSRTSPSSAEASGSEASKSPDSSPAEARDEVKEFPASLATWINKEHGFIRINSKEGLANKWFLSKGNNNGSWELLEEEVLSTFQARSIIKIISNLPTIIQVFCVRQLLL